MNDTPRSDAAILRSNLDEVAEDCVPVSFARELERENAELRKIVDEAARCFSGPEEQEACSWGYEVAIKLYQASRRFPSP